MLPGCLTWPSCREKLMAIAACSTNDAIEQIENVSRCLHLRLRTCACVLYMPCRQRCLRYVRSALRSHALAPLGGSHASDPAVCSHKYCLPRRSATISSCSATARTVRSSRCCTAASESWGGGGGGGGGRTAAGVPAAALVRAAGTTAPAVLCRRTSSVAGVHEQAADLPHRAPATLPLLPNAVCFIACCLRS